MKRFLLALALLMLTSVAARTAEASFYGYVCDVTHYKYGGEGSMWGTSGFIDVSFYSGPHCTGSYVGYHYYCSKEAYAPWCASDASRLLSEAEVSSLRNELLESGRWGNYVSSYDTACRGGSPNLCGSSVRFYSYANR
ncbi:MAG: hypothetical protein SGI86_13085 [Deltaproteobacteria bacterium]|nr:hypothetical protein [Deltaproteobacteria bacterium]